MYIVASHDYWAGVMICEETYLVVILIIIIRQNYTTLQNEACKKNVWISLDNITK